ncbi:MAG TPA: glycoside hydrolase family 18 protein, partial [Candidatus Limnocylindrales bacterium]
IVLGLPLYGMRWRMSGPGLTTAVIGSGVTWVPNQHLDVLLGDGFYPGRDPIEISEVFWTRDGVDWLVTTYDSPATLRPKMALARDNGLAGAGFWAMGYERGLPGFVELMTDFRNGDVARTEAPTRQ